MSPINHTPYEYLIAHVQQSLRSILFLEKSGTPTFYKITILTATATATATATSGLYPKGKISPLQEKLFCALGGNIRTIAIDGDFDACQALVKQAFDDEALKKAIGLNSANSINISRLLAQVCYYFEAVAQLPKADRAKAVISVPSGNFGNLTAGLIAKALGLPVKRFIAATNANDTVPRYLKTGQWEPHQTVATLSNAMDELAASRGAVPSQGLGAGDPGGRYA